MRNLVSNAFKFTPEGGSVRLGCWEFFPFTMRIDDGINADKEKFEPWLYVNGNRIHFAHDHDEFESNPIVPKIEQQSSSSPLSNISSEVSTPITSEAQLLLQETSISDSVPCQSPNSSRTDHPSRKSLSNESLTSNGSLGVSLCEKSYRDHPFVRVMVTDSGQGIHANDQMNLFKQFAQVRPEELQRGQGSGLGLWIAANIIHMHGGRIGVVSPGEGQGSSFLFDLPLVTGNNSNSGQQATDERSGEIQQHQTINHKMQVEEQEDDYEEKNENSNYFSGMDDSDRVDNARKANSPTIKRKYFSNVTLSEARILIVDDATSNRKMVRRILCNNFHFIDEADQGQHAVEMYEKAYLDGKPYHIIMMDFLMPVMSGLEATERIRQFEKQELFNEDFKCAQSSSITSSFSTLIVGVTGNGQDDGHDAFIHAGADSVFVKPISIQNLVNFVSKYFPTC